MESETDASEERLSNTTGRLVQLEREVGLLRQNNREVGQLVDTVEKVSNEADQNAKEAQQVLTETLCLLIHRFEKCPACPGLGHQSVFLTSLLCTGV